ncbi:CMP deaminase, partial [Clostridium perfringens]
MSADQRKDWDTYFMDIAFMVSTRSQCPRRHVGAVLVQG